MLQSTRAHDLSTCKEVVFEIYARVISFVEHELRDLFRIYNITK